MRASAAHQAVLDKHGLIGSMSRMGNGWGNAVREQFFLSLKKERVWQWDYANKAEVTTDCRGLEVRGTVIGVRLGPLGRDGRVGS